MRKGKRLILFCGGCLCWSLYADAVELKNGDRLSGRLVALEEGQLYLQTSYAGEVRLDWKQVQGIWTEEPCRVELQTGAPISGVLHSPQAGLVQVSREGEDPQTLPLNALVSLRRGDLETEPVGFLRRWKGHLNLGYTVTRGNADLDNLAVHFQPEYLTEQRRFRLELQALYSVQDGRSSSDLYKGRLRYDHFLGSRTFLFAISSFEKDRREELRLRTTQGGGFGWRWNPGRKTQISLLGGVTFLQEDFTGLKRDLGAEALTALEVESGHFQPVQISGKFQLLPVFDEGRYRYELDTNLQIPLVGGFNVGLQFFTYFDSRPPRGAEKTDRGLLSSLGFRF